MAEEDTKQEATEEVVTAPETTEPAAEPQEEPAMQDASEEPAFKSKLENTTLLKSGMTVRVHERIKDVNPRGEERERIQVFEGMIIAMHGGTNSRTITVRKVTKGFGVEKIYPINSPIIVKIEMVKVARVRRAKLGYLKNKKNRFKRKLKETWVKK